MTRIEIMKTAHGKGKLNGTNVSYREKLSIGLKTIYKEIEEKKYLATVFNNVHVSIPYEKTKLRQVVKDLGAKWNAETKTWVFTSVKDWVLKNNNLKDRVVLNPTKSVVTTKPSVNNFADAEFNDDQYGYLLLRK